MSIEETIKNWTRQVEKRLSALLPSDQTYPPAIHQSMNYSIKAGGKRFRPLLIMAAAHALGADKDNALDTGCAAEMIHTYTLIHDDLPCMDDDDLRRGKPSNHKVYGQATALLAGDGLLTHAFGVMAAADGLDAQTKMETIKIMAEKTGSTGVIGGQVVDIDCTGDKKVDFDTVKYIHAHKTAAFLQACTKIGAVIAKADAKKVDEFDKLGYDLGMAFQIIDDILDITGDVEKMGKTIGKDQNTDKATYPAMIGLEESRKQAANHIEQAKTLLADIPQERKGPLEFLADLIINRDF